MAVIVAFFLSCHAGAESFVPKNIETKPLGPAGVKTRSSSIVSLKSADSRLNKNANKVKNIQPAQDQKEPTAFAKANSSGKEYLVKKLDYLNKTLPPGDKAEKALNLRLAHALSLIAEENFIKHEKEKCSDCLKTAQQTARRSLAVYKQLDSVLLKQPLLHTTALFKQAYLERFLGNKMQSLFQLKRVAKKGNIPELLTTRAWYNMAEIYFELYRYDSALSAFNQVLKVKSSPWEFKAVYRKIWSLFNLSRYQESIEELMAFLKSDLYAGAKPEDQNLKRKLENELVTLYSYSQISDQNLDFLYHFNKQNPAKNSLSAKNQRFFDLAQDLNRIGRLKESNQVWQAYLSKTAEPEERLLAYSFILNNDTVLNYPNKLEVTGRKIEKIIALQKKTPKYKEEISLKIQNFFSQIALKKLNSNKRKEYLLSLYQKYNAVYPANRDTLLAEANLAESLKQYTLAGSLFRQISARMKNPEQKKLKEQLSVRQMELAELAKNDDTRSKAYRFYIKHGIKADLVFKAKYQIAYMAYSSKELKKARKLFDELVLPQEQFKNNKSIQDLRLKSAHLLLAVLNQAGDQEELLINKAGLFMERFPEKRKEFAEIYNSAVLNTVKGLVSDKDFSRRPSQASQDKNILKAWELLNKFSIKDAGKEKLSAYYVDKLLLAKELLKFEQMDQSLKFLLSNKNLSKEDRKIALTWKLWLAELRFDFKEVLRIVKVLDPSNQSEDNLLRLARLSELAGDDPIPYYKTFIKRFPNSSFSPAVLAGLIEKSSSEKEKKEFLKKHSAFYKQDANKLTYLILKVDRGLLDSEFIAHFTSLPFMRNTFLDSFEKRRQVIESFKKALRTISAYSLPSGLSSSRLNFKLKKWTRAVEDLQKTAKALLKTQDWTSRVFIVSHWKKELERFYNSVISLPVPKALTEKEQKEYKSLLLSQMQIYEGQVKQLEKELGDLWSQNFLNDYYIGLGRDFVFYPLLSWELDHLEKLAEGQPKEQIQILLSSLSHKLEGKKTKKKTAQTERSEVNNLYKILQKNPFDKKSLTELLSLEKNNEALSFYLANRIEELKQKKGREQL